jgi:molybdopterin-containing oxidoreductase family membrane subunit
VVPFSLHHYADYKLVVIPAELLSIVSIMMCFMFVMVDLGQPSRILNIFLYPSLKSVMFWDFIVLSVYLLTNLALFRASMLEFRYKIPLPTWYRPLMVFSIPWAVGIHTVTAFLFSALVGRPSWFSALLTPRFLASAFASGPALLLLVLFALSRKRRIAIEPGILRGLRVSIAYALAIHLFFAGVELFEFVYGQTLENTQLLEIFSRQGAILPVMLLSVVSYLLVIFAFGLLISRAGKDPRGLWFASLATFLGILLEKGISLVVTGFLATPEGARASYFPTLVELGIVAGIWAFGALVFSLIISRVLQVQRALTGELEPVL